MLYGFDVLNNLIYNDCREHLDNLYRINGYDNIIIEYINRTIASKTFFEDDDIENLKDEYLKKLNKIVYTFKDYTFKMKILIYMELMRLNAMYESIGEEVAIISQTGLNVAFLGIGVCDAQSKYLCNLLIAFGFKASSVKLIRMIITL